MQMMENIGIGLKILTDDGIKLVNIGKSKIAHFMTNVFLIEICWHYSIFCISN